MNGISDTSAIISLQDHIQDISKRRIKKMLRHKIRHVPPVKIGDFVYFLRDKNRWLGPA